MGLPEGNGLGDSFVRLSTAIAIHLFDPTKHSYVLHGLHSYQTHSHLYRVTNLELGEHQALLDCCAKTTILSHRFYLHNEDSPLFSCNAP
ncbi:hypothetical protein NPIL_557551 [Nephila pilipes]|uniref:Uncharacterized protein n=1 Tax=Nephila pilipes TaxID=299642 RepID=A0A8X6IXB4_NEPPI|nr:hypothetical protein NPIL_557551 [Nephila pilipes]